MNDAPFRVVRTYFRLPPEPGGMEEHIARLSAAQREQGIEVVNVFNVGAAEGEAVQLYRGRDLLGVRPAMLRNLVFYAAALSRSRSLRSAKPTVLHVHGDWSDFLFGRLLARAIGAHVMAASLHDLVPGAKGALYRATLRSFDPIFTTGRADQAFLSAELGKPVQHMPSAPHPDFFSAGPPVGPVRYDVISVTNFFEKKAPELVLDCAARRPDLRFALFGDGPLLEKLRARITGEGIGNIVLPGRRSRAEVIVALRESRLFLSTALREGTPTAALEAMAVGLPILITPSNDYGWLMENGRNGWITRGWQIDDIVDRMDAILQDDTKARAMGAANHAAAAAFSWAANAARVSALMAARLGLEWTP